MKKELENIRNNVDLFNYLTDNICSVFDYNQSYTQIIQKGTRVFAELIDCDYAALYLTNNETFEFEHIISYPDIIKADFPKIFEDLVNKGAVGSALKKAELTPFTDNSVNYLIVPMLGSSGIKGIILIVGTINFENIELSVLKIFQCISHTFSIVLENREMQVEQMKSNELLDQLIASRTIHLVETNKKLGDKIESLKRTLTMSIPHEVRTPINQIIGFSDFLINHYSEDITKENQDFIDILSDIRNSGDRLKNLFENFIYYTRLTLISTSIKEMEEQQQRVTYYCESIILDQIMIKAHQYDRVADMEINLVSANILVTEEYLAKLSNEIIDNALKFSLPGTKIEVNSNIEGLYYNMRFKDYGQGFDTEYITEIDTYMQFERESKEQQGLGLGLSIAQRIVDIHNGYIDIRSQKDVYTEVTVKFLIAQNTTMDL